MRIHEEGQPLGSAMRIVLFIAALTVRGQQSIAVQGAPVEAAEFDSRLCRGPEKHAAGWELWSRIRPARRKTDNIVLENML
jgi:hypothetical protein